MLCSYDLKIKFAQWNRIKFGILNFNKAKIAKYASWKSIVMKVLTKE